MKILRNRTLQQLLRFTAHRGIEMGYHEGYKQGLLKARQSNTGHITGLSTLVERDIQFIMERKGW